MNTKELMDKAAAFHGHSCPGLALGVVASSYILEHENDFSVDEELVAVIENDNCSVDALQALLGTTFGKGNFIFKDYGKNSYTFYNRIQEKAVRLSIKTDLFGNMAASSREEMIDAILNSKPESLFDIQTVAFDPPGHAKIHDSVICYDCGEPTMATRTQEHDNVKLCIPCRQKREAAG